MKKKELKARLCDMERENEFLNDFASAALSIIRQLVKDEDTPGITNIVFDDMLTAVVWSDGKVTKTHCAHDDTYDPLIGLLNCIIRRLTGNKGHGVEYYEPVIRYLADQIEFESDIDDLVNDFAIVRDTLCTLRKSKDVWRPFIGDDDGGM